MWLNTTHRVSDYSNEVISKINPGNRETEKQIGEMYAQGSIICCKVAL